MTSIQDNIRGKVAIVTGASSGLGESTARHLAARGAKVVLAARRTDRLDAVVAEIRAAGGEAIAVVTDVAQRADLERLAAATVEAFGRIDVLVNNAGTLVGRVPVTDLDDDFIDRVFDVNCRQLIHCCRIVAKLMKAQGSGNIINVTSIAARTGSSPGGAVYAGAKAFVSAFSKTLAKELVGSNVRVNCVSPGTIHTAFHDRYSDEAKREATRKTIPMQRLGVARDCAGTFLYLASDAASGYVTGQVIEVNGGQLMA